MTSCPFCGGHVSEGALVCPNCNNELGQQANAYPEGEGPKELDHGVPGSEIPTDRGGGAGIDRPGDITTSVPEASVPAGTPVERDLSMAGPAVDLTGGVGPSMPTQETGDPSGAPPERRTMRLQFGALVVILLIVVASIAGYYIITGEGDGDGDGNGNGEVPNGNANGGPGPVPLDAAFEVNETGTVGEYIYEPTIGYDLTVVIRNYGSKGGSLNGHDVFVTMYVGMAKVGEATEALSGALAPGATKTIEIFIDDVTLESGVTVKVSVLLRKDGGNTSVDLYDFEQTVE